ncbi:MAG: DNA topoisomerase VI subunit B [Euryarchaeota archaeon]|jgi:DNA topoisomerase-6 subunit B|nr:DNA topoisomerase VI subunit B [Euryarchaeota archaeon]MBF14892.1 DNA topoisomerase VI subunit B [Euryarchaeota archaeon]|tara:strand:- start:8558 stop:10624 length:2067 start_codon:yes stop_codon:yes gene_type:complete
MSIAEKMAANQKQVAISEFFEKNKHFLGFDTLNRALITAVKEAVDNALDACEEARILPDIVVKITKLDNSKDILQLEVEDNGPGIPRASIQKVFGQLLFGSRFHAIRQSRGQQGIGITGVVMYSQLTTGDPTHVESKIAKEATAVSVDIGLDTRKNKAIKSNQDRIDWGEKVHGLKIKTKLKAKYQRGRQSVWQYLRMTSIVNPHADILFIDPDGEKHHWQRVTERLPGRVEAIKPHPNGIELGQLQRLCSESSESRMTTFLRRTFSGVSQRAAKELCEVSELEEKLKPKSLSAQQVRSLLEAFQGERLLKGKAVKLLNPPTSCLSPIEELLIKKGLSKTIDSKFVTTMTRAPNVTQGNPFQVEVGLIFGEGMAADKPVEILRFANRVPLMYQQGGCLLTKAVESVDWRQYGLDQPGGRGVPKGPAAILVHLASTNVQFTSEAKEALSDNETVMEEARKAMLEMGRGLRKHLEKQKKMSKTIEKFELINDIIPAIAKKSASLLDLPVPDLAASITKIMSAVIAETTTTWNKETKQTDVHIILYNYTSRARSYTMLVNWPERQGATMVGNDLGGRKEAMGVWAWKLETLQPGSQTVIAYSLDGLEKGDWNETDVFYRGSQEVIGATKMDEKLLEEIRRQEEALNAPPPEEGEDSPDDEEEEDPVEDAAEPEPTAPAGDTKQTTLFGGDY